MLGGPGSGKTWLARRTARRCAEAALNALVLGAVPEEVELPLYTTCARLAAAPHVDGIRRAVVASALGQLPDLGGSRVLQALQAFFEDRDAPTLLVTDSLDEAHGAGDRIRLADTLHPAWRIMLTSRSASWNHQLAIGADDPSRRVGILQPLRYPEDVEPFITGWFTGQPGWAAALSAQLRDRPALQQAATVPLILAFYCMISGGQPLPARRADVYAKVIRRMLTGRWRSSGDRDVDPDACLEVLRDWAWSAAVSDPISGVGAWVDEFPTPRLRHGHDNGDALDGVAPPLGPPDVDTGMTQRRFAHRSLREHLVAEHVALRMTAGQAAAELLKHLWYEPDWEYAAPAGLTMHPQRAQVLKELISHVTDSDQYPASLESVDGCWEFRRFLARVAQESGEEDWPPEAAEMIERARVDLVASRRGDLRQVVTGGWPTSDRLIIDMLLADAARSGAAFLLKESLARLDPDAPERARYRKALFQKLTSVTDPRSVRELAQAFAMLDPTARQRAHARDGLLTRLTEAAGTWEAQLLAEPLVLLAVTAPERAGTRQALLARLANVAHPALARPLALALTALHPTRVEKAQARQLLLAHLASKNGRVRLRGLAEEFAKLDPPPRQKAQVRNMLLMRLSALADPEKVRELAQAFAGLGGSAQDKAWSGEVLLTQNANGTGPWLARGLVDALAVLDPTTQNKTRASQSLLTMLASSAGAWLAKTLTDALTALDSAASAKARARATLLTLLAAETNPTAAWNLAGALTALNPAVPDKAQAREILLALLVRQTTPMMTQELAQALPGMDLTGPEKTQVRSALLAVLPIRADAAMARELAEARAWQTLALLFATEYGNQPGMAWDLVHTLAGLTPPAPSQLQGEALLSTLADGLEYTIKRDLVNTLTALDPSARDKAKARSALLPMLDDKADPAMARETVRALIQLTPTTREQARVRRRLLVLLASRADAKHAAELGQQLARFGPNTGERARARAALLGLLASQADPANTRELGQALATLTPVIGDLADSREWPLPPPAVLLAAIRRTTALSDWLTAYRSCPATPAPHPGAAQAPSSNR